MRQRLNSFQDLEKINPVKRAINENRLYFHKNGSYSYVPSKEYKEHISKISSNKMKSSVNLLLRNGVFNKVKNIYNGNLIFNEEN